MIALDKLRHEGKELNAPFLDSFKGYRSKDFSVQSFAAICDALYCSFLPKPPTRPCLHYLCERSRTPEMSQAFVKIVGKPNLEAVGVVLWLQTQQIKNTDVVERSIRELSFFTFLFILEVST